MTKEKSKLPPMPEHDGGENCPACAEQQRVIDELEKTELMARFKKLSAHIDAEHEAIEKEYGVRMSTLFMATFKNEQTDRVGISPKQGVIRSADMDVMMDLLQHLNKEIAMPSIMDKLKSIFGDKADMSSMGLKTPMGKAGQA